MEKRFFEAVATLVGTTIGAGVLGIPYVVAQSGVLIGLLHILIIGTAVMLVNLLLGEVVTRTRGNHQLTGYAGKYLGTTGKRLVTITMAAGIYGALLAYIIGTGVSLNSILPGLPTIAGSIIFFAIASAVVYFGLEAVEKSELLLAFLTIAVIILITIVATTSDKFSAANFTGTNIKNAFMPYGVVLFAFLGAVAIPEMKEELGKKRKLLKKAIIIGGLIPLILYTIFTVAVIGISGASTSQIATTALGAKLGNVMTILANIIAVLAMSTSFIALGLALKEMYVYDYKLKKNAAWFLTCIIPLAAFLFGVKSFIAVLGIAGAVTGGVEGILLVIMHGRAQKKRAETKPVYTIKKGRYMAAALVLMFLAGIIYAVAKASGW